MLVFLPQVVQKCQLSIGRLAEAEAKSAEWAAEKEEPQKALEAKDEQLRERGEQECRSCR